jgi:hypothetical protein
VAYGFLLAAQLALAATGDVFAARASALPAALQAQAEAAEAVDAAPLSAPAAEVAAALLAMVS